MGEIDYNQIPEIISSLSKLKDDAFEIDFTGLNGFPNSGRTHTLWVGIKDNLGLFYLQKKIAEHLRKLKLKIDEKKFIPHLTIARLSREKSIEKLTFKKELGTFTAKEFILYESELLSGGSKHTSIKSFRLKNV